MISQRSSETGRNDGLAGILPVDRGIYTIGALRRYRELVHGVSTRVSPEGGDWNLSSKRGSPQFPPDPAVALANRQSLAERLGISLDRTVGCHQIHGSEVALVGETDGGRGMRAGSPSIEGADAMVTSTPGLNLMVLAADCPPVFFYDPVKRAIGLAHSGWKGTVGRIAGRTVEAMVQHFGSDPANIVVAVGPGIGPCCYCVGSNVVEEVEASFPRAWTDGPLLDVYEGQVYFNLPAAIKRAVVDAGVPPRNVTIEGVCTAHYRSVFYSHRGDAGQCGLFGAVLGLLEG
jgi:YfiH family protein